MHNHTAPAIHPLGEIILSPPHLTHINGIKTYGYSGGQKDIIKVSLVFDAGRWTEEAPLIADAVARLIKSGTKQWDAATISRKIDLYGASIKAGAGYNTFTISLSCINRFLEPSLELLKTCISEIIFPENEIVLLQEKSQMQLQINLKRNEYVAEMALKLALFGEKHPYGYDIREEDIAAISSEKLHTYYTKQLCPELATIFLSGKYGDKEISLLENALKPSTWYKQSPKSHAEHVICPSGNKNVTIQMPNSVQSSIAMGMPLFNRQHEDFIGIILLNTIFGGYFGSRLMQNIREEKGMTYGIYSEIQTYKHGGILLISTETDLKYQESCIEEIHKESSRLKRELVSDEELLQARNYLLGKLLSRTDGPFNRSTAYKNLYIEGFDENKFNQTAEKLRLIDNKMIKALAEQYLHTESMYSVVVN